jgi:hypothetical protein
MGSNLGGNGWYGTNGRCQKDEIGPGYACYRIKGVPVNDPELHRLAQIRFPASDADNLADLPLISQNAGKGAADETDTYYGQPIDQGLGLQ